MILKKNSKNYNEHYGEIDGMNEFPSREKYLSSPKKQIEFYMNQLAQERMEIEKAEVIINHFCS